MTVAEFTQALDQSEVRCQQDEVEAFELLLQAELRSFNAIQDGQHRWEEAVRTGTMRFDFQFDREMTRRYQIWVFKARKCLRQLELQEEKGACPESSATFRERLEMADEFLLTRTQDEAAAISILQDAE